MKKLFFVTSLLFISVKLFAQLSIDAEFINRGEYRHGYRNLFPDSVNPAALVVQRTSLKTRCKADKLEFYIDLLDARTWGDVRQVNPSDLNGLKIHEAWAKIELSNNLFLKSGRQEIQYDDFRIFWRAEWPVQKRSHDLALLKYESDSFKVDLGLAYNQDGQALTGNLSTVANYKTMQHAWIHKKWKKLSASFLLVNIGNQFIHPTHSQNIDSNETRFSQTIGTHLNYKNNKLSILSNAFFQTGVDVNNNDLNAHFLGLEANYKSSDKLKFGLGTALYSGNENGAPANGKNNAFTPLFGANHKHNGHMDYFYLGNHINNVGLVDMYINSKISLNKKSTFNIALHNFSSEANLTGTSDKQLGQEVDINYTYKVQKDVTVKVGYSHMFTEKGMEILKGNSDGNTNNFAWLMLIVKPNLYKASAKSK